VHGEGEPAHQVHGSGHPGSLPHQRGPRTAQQNLKTTNFFLKEQHASITLFEKLTNNQLFETEQHVSITLSQKLVTKGSFGLHLVQDLAGFPSTSSQRYMRSLFCPAG